MALLNRLSMSCPHIHMLRHAHVHRHTPAHKRTHMQDTDMSHAKVHTQTQQHTLRYTDNHTHKCTHKEMLTLAHIIGGHSWEDMNREHFTAIRTGSKRIFIVNEYYNTVSSA